MTQQPRTPGTEAGRKFVEQRRERHDALGHAPTNSFTYCAEPDGVSATVCDEGRWLRAFDADCADLLAQIEKRELTTPLIRFWRQVRPSADDGCWYWLGSLTQGYGRFSVRGTDYPVHRWAYEQFVGPIPDGLTIDHLCRNRACVNPDHLEPVTNRENVLRGEGLTADQVRRTHCPRGHAYDEANTRLAGPKRNMRSCRACEHDRNVRVAANRKIARHKARAAAIRSAAPVEPT